MKCPFAENVECPETLDNNKTESECTGDIDACIYFRELEE